MNKFKIFPQWVFFYENPGLIEKLTGIKKMSALNKALNT